MLLFKLIYNKFFLLVISIFFSTQFTFSQTLIMNEVSNGTSGNQEYVEFVVVDATATYDCNQITPPCIDIRGWIFDDNSGYHGAVGVAAGAVRFSFDPLWSCVPLGTIIVIHNDGDPNPAMPANDLSMADGNCRIIAPISSLTLFEKNSTTPGSIACSYPATGWVAGGTWSNTLFANTGDCARIVDLAGCEVFSVCYATANTNNLIYFSSGGSGGQNVWFFNGGNPTIQANWSEGSASPSPGQQTPGVANNAANAAYISQFNNSCTPITPILVNAVSTNADCVCDGTATATASGSIGGYTYVWYDASFIPIGQTSANATGLCAGTYHVIATSSIGCPDTTQVVITNSGGVPNTTITPAGPFCQSAASVNLTAATGGGTWSGTGITNTAAGTFNPSTAGAGTFTITYSIGGACPGSSTTTVTVNSPTIPTFAVIAPICSGGSIILPNTSTNGITGTWSPAINNLATTTYIFTPTVGQCATTTTITVNVGSPVTPVFTAIAPICNGDAIILPTTSNDGFTGTWSPSIDNTTTTTYTFTPDLGQCAANTTLTVAVNPIPVVDPIANQNVCNGDPILASNFTSSPTGSVFDWTNSNTSIGLASSGSGNTPAFNAINATGSSISGTISVIPTFNGCVGNALTFSITVNDQLNATITPVGPFCESNTSITLTAVDAGGTWTGNGITNSTNGNFDPFSAGVGTHIITYTISGSCGDLQTTSISVNPDLDATINAAGPFCTNDPAIALSALDAGGTWSGTGITNASLGIFDPSIANIGVNTITYTISGACGDIQSINIIVTDQLNASISPLANVCEQDPSFNLSAVDPGGTWSGTGITNFTLGTFDPSIAGIGTHTITYTISGSCGDAQTTTITVLNNADATISTSGPFCLTSPSLSLTSVDPGGVWTGNGITNAVTGTFDPSIAGVGTHLITYTISGQCGDVETILLTVTGLLNSTINPVSALCENALPFNFTAATSGGVWSGTGITNSVTGTFDPNAAGVGTHTITYTLPGICGTASSFDIIVNPLPIADFSLDNVSGCIPLTVTFTDQSAPTGGNLNWIISDGFSSNLSGTMIHTFNSAGCFDVTLEYTSSQGCISSLTQNNVVCVDDIPQAEFSWSPNDVTILNPLVNFSNESIGATVYDWDFAGLGNSTQTNPSYLFANDVPRTYEVCLSATNALGCIDTVCHVIVIEDEFIVYVPNAFTPDQDGNNEIFIPIISGHDPEEYEFMIFDRWGELIFISESSNSGWDGSYKGWSSKEDVYVWKLNVKEANNNKQHNLIGHLSLLR
jgi:gliding motility-associated-like protein